MKFSGVHVILSLLFATAFAVPARWDDDELLTMSNDNEVQEKRIAPLVAWALVKAKKAALGAAIKWACNSTNLPDRLKGICACGSMVAGDEEVELEEHKRWFGNAWSYLKSKVNEICNSKWGKLIGSVCQCVRAFI